MQIAVITTPRTPEYVYATIHQIRRGCGAMTIEAFSDDPAYRVNICPTRFMPPYLQERRDAAPPSLRACLNFHHALSSGTGDLMLFEDDLLVRPTWLDTVRALHTHNPDALISLYWPDDAHLSGLAGVDEVIWREYRKPETVHGTLGLFVPGEYRAALERYTAFPTGPFDNMVAWWLHQNPEVRLIAPMRAQVDHAGEVSAIPSNADHGPRRTPGW